MSGFRLSRRASNDLAEIHAHISHDNPTAANRLLEGLIDLFGFMAKSPSMGQKRDDLRPNLRAFTHGNYVVFFYPVHDGVEIVAVIHGARDVDTALGAI